MACEISPPLFESDDLPDFLSKDLRSPIEKHLDTHRVPSDEENADKDALEDDGNESQDEQDTDSDDDYTPNTTSFRSIKHESSCEPPKVRMSGGVPPIRKKVYAEGDSDDEIIWDMKQKGYRDQPVCDYLIAEGRTKYDVKTIATRYARIKKAKIAAQEKQLESDFEDYLEEDDAALRAAMDEDSGRHQKELADVEDRRWTMVVDAMNAKLPAAKFTKRLARERWEALKNGTAVVPFEQDPDPEARTARIQKEKADRRQLKEEERLRAIREEEAKVAAHENAIRTKEEIKAANKRKRETKLAAAEAKRAKAKIDADAAAAVRRKEIEQKAASKVEQIMNRERRKQEAADKKAASAWQKQLQMAELRQKKQEQKLRRAQENADTKAAAIKAEIENTKRKELIRRHMRLSGASVAAPLVEAPTAVSIPILNSSGLAKSTKSTKAFTSLGNEDELHSDCDVNDDKSSFKPNSSAAKAFGQADAQDGTVVLPKFTRSKAKLIEASPKAASITTPATKIAKAKANRIADTEADASNAKTKLPKSARSGAAKHQDD